MAEFIEGTTRAAGRLLLSALILGCGVGCGGGSSDCPNLAGAYSVTTEIVSTDCRLGLHAISQPVTWTFEQTAPSCSFKMTNSLYGSKYSGSFKMDGTQAKVTWTTVDPAPTVAGYALSYTSEDLTLTPGVAPAAGTISGSFVWSNTSPCGGTTNVCSGTIPAGCLSPK
jgi:hypothetical protein